MVLASTAARFFSASVLPFSLSLDFFLVALFILTLFPFALLSGRRRNMTMNEHLASLCTAREKERPPSSSRYKESIVLMFSLSDKHRVHFPFLILSLALRRENFHINRSSSLKHTQREKNGVNIDRVQSFL